VDGQLCRSRSTWTRLTSFRGEAQFVVMDEFLENRGEMSRCHVEDVVVRKGTGTVREFFRGYTPCSGTDPSELDAQVTARGADTDEPG